MACALTSGYTVDCRDGIGGVQEVYFIEKNNVDSMTETAGVITAIAKATGKQFRKYQQIKESSYGKDTPEGNSENGTMLYNHEVGIAMNRMATATRNEIILIAKNYLITVVKDNNGKFWMYGREYGLEVTGGEGGTGKAMSDRNGYTLVLTGKEREPAIEVEAAIAAALETAGT